MTRGQCPRRAVAAGDWHRALDEVAGSTTPVLLHAPDAVFALHLSSYLDAVLAIADAPGVAGATLGLPRWRSADRVPFTPVPDGADTLYLRSGRQVALLVTPSQAARARDGGVTGEDWSDYLTASGQYLIAPTSPLAFATGRGLHAMLAVGDRAWRLHALDGAVACYDASYELAPAAAARLDPALAGLAVRIDLWGRTGAEAIDPDLHLVSSRPCRRPIAGYPLELAPVEANLALRGDGGFFSLGRAADFAEMTLPRREMLYRHATRYNAMGDYAAQFLGPLARIAARVKR
ncbi:MULTISPECIES: hypothetical protein [unclassified Sphingomonas]|uniref:hypothetical protein n=4 Tax=Sphingomonas TaxID=13687 RepID=UPI00082C209D|nr:MULTISPECIES: hypothetical protein [unclassified Sphingomonas]